MNISLLLIVGLALGFVALNFLLFLTLCLCKWSQRKTEVDYGSYPSLDNLKRRSLLKRHGAGLRAQVAIDSKEMHDPYTRLPRQSPKRPLDQLPFPEALLHSPRRTLAISPGLYPSMNTPTKMNHGYLGKIGDTASIYSMESAPIDLHDQILLSQPFSRALCSYQTNVLPGVRSAGTSVSVAKATDLIPPLLPTTQCASIEEVASKTYRYQGSELSTTSPFQDPTGSSDALRHQWYAPILSKNTAEGLSPEHLRLPTVGLVPMAREVPLLHRQFSLRLPSPHSPPPPLCEGWMSSDGCSCVRLSEAPFE